MKRLKILFYLVMAFLLTVNVTNVMYKAKAQDRLPGYSEWSFESSGQEGEISAKIYGYKEAVGFGEPQESKPEDGYYRETTKWKMENYSKCGCDWGRYSWKYNSGISCWMEDAGWATYLCNARTITYADSNTCSEKTCKATQISTYEPVTAWGEATGWRTDSPYEKTSTTSPVEATVYSYPLTFTINFDDGQVVNIKHGQTLPSVKVPSRIGYIFKGFFDSGGRQFYDEHGYTSVVYEEGMATSLIARWEPITYTVNFYANGGSGYMAGQVLKYDQPISTPGCSYTKNNNTFVGWKYGTTLYKQGDSIVNLTSTNNAIVTLSAEWKEEKEIIVTPPKEKEESKDNNTTKKKVSNSDTNINKSDLDSENYFLIRIPQELVIDNNNNTLGFEVKGKLKDKSALKIELPNTLYLKTKDLNDYEMVLKNIDEIKASELSETFKEIDITLSHPFDNNEKYNVSLPLTIQVISK